MSFYLGEVTSFSPPTLYLEIAEMFSWNKCRIRKPDADIWHMKFQLKYKKLQGLWETGKNEFGSQLSLATFVNIAYVKWIGLSPM